MVMIFLTLLYGLWGHEPHVGGHFGCVVLITIFLCYLVRILCTLMDVGDDIGMYNTPNGLAWGKNCTLKCFPPPISFHFPNQVL